MIGGEPASPLISPPPFPEQVASLVFGDAYQPVVDPITGWIGVPTMRAHCASSDVDRPNPTKVVLALFKWSPEKLENIFIMMDRDRADFVMFFPYH